MLDAISEEYKSNLDREICYLLSTTSGAWDEVLRELGSVDVSLAKEIFDSKRRQEHAFRTEREKFQMLKANAREKTSQFIINLPAANSLLSQWWFTINTIEKLACRIKRQVGSGSVLFIGAPNVAHFYHVCFPESQVQTFDVDKDIIDELNKNGVPAVLYDVLTDKPSQVKCSNFGAVFMDPPWYQPAMDCFIEQASCFISNHSYLFCVLPSKLTRPDFVNERDNYLKHIFQLKYKLVSIESNYVDYSIPSFESEVFNSSKSDIHKPWRRADFLVAEATQTHRSAKLPEVVQKIHTFHSEAQGTNFRVYLKESVDNPDQDHFLVKIEEFSKEISSRKNRSEQVHLWTSGQYGFSVKNNEIMQLILCEWKKGSSFEETIERVHRDKIQDIVTEVQRSVNLWPEKIKSFRRTPDKIQESNQVSLSVLATITEARRQTQSNDGFRPEFQRDRDRIIWSESFRSLANKCQVFSFADTEKNSVRTRLTHSIEVMQLATTIGNAFGLNRDLIEAGALAHDIGHTPFGHGGEYALSETLKFISKDFHGFNHYEHGINVLEFLESPYISSSNGQFVGLNLMPSTLECVMKHTYSKTEGLFAQDRVIQNSMYSELFDNSFGSLESQSVRAADKISYLLSDIEDGIRMGAIHYSDIIKCRLFNKAPIDFSLQGKTETTIELYNLFVSQKRSVLKLIMEDLITSSNMRLVAQGIKCHDDIRTAKQYCIELSPNMSDCFCEVWSDLQSSLLHNFSKVKQSNYKAGQIVNALFYLYTLNPRLIDEDYQQKHKALKNSSYIANYRRKVGERVVISSNRVSQLGLNLSIGNDLVRESDNYHISIEDVIQARDYVASLTDFRALNEYRAHFGSFNV